MSVLITPGQVEEWVREVEVRPQSAALIIREISSRLGELAEQNEALLAENIALRSEKRVQEYESRIANLEYQLEILKRQVGESLEAPLVETLSLLVYEASGRILRIGLDVQAMSSGSTFGSFAEGISRASEPPQLLAIGPQEELLCVFDSGRTANLPVAEIPVVDGHGLDWERAYVRPPRGGERLASILPIARMALSEFCVQFSRRGYVKKIREAFLESCIARANIGSGVISASDKTFGLALCDAGDILVLASEEGQLLSVSVEQLPYTIEEALRLGMSDHLVSGFIVGEKTSILALTQDGKAFHRDMDWLEMDSPPKSQKRSILSKARREAGTRIVAAVAVDEQDWGAVLTSAGALTIYKMSDVFGRGSLLSGSGGVELLGFAAFSA